MKRTSPELKRIVPKVGQVWRRNGGRKIVIRVEKVVTEGPDPHVIGRNFDTDRKTTIQLDYFSLTGVKGFTLVPNV